MPARPITGRWGWCRPPSGRRLHRPEQLGAGQDDVEDEDDGPGVPDKPADGPPAEIDDKPAGAGRTRLIAGIVTGVLVVAAIVYVGSQGRQTVGVTTSSETAITRVLGQAEPSDEVTVRLSVAPEADWSWIMAFTLPLKSARKGKT